MGLEGFRIRMENAEARLDSMHTGLGSVRGKGHKHDSELGVLKTEFKAQREDMGELKDQMKWVIRGLVAATLTFTGLIVTILTAVFSNG